MVSSVRRGSLVAQRYRRLGLIGRGATGSVYRAHDRLSGRVVALKTVSVDPASENTPARSPADVVGGTAGAQLLLEREFVLLAGLRHPNIIASLDYGTDGTFGPFFTMDLHEEARTLRAAASGQSLTTKIDLLVQLLHALAYLHRRGLVHRDLKPENALCARGVLKLIDLGLASPVGEPPASRDGAGGTLAYAAPEIVRGAPADERTDLYAVGVIAYEILTGALPFDASSPGRLLQAVFTKTPDFDRPGLDPAIADVLRRLLAREPSARFGDALDVVEALSSALGRPLSVETMSTRHSFLHAASFVGREAERERLRCCLPVSPREVGSAEENPRAGAILVAGESGAGKSRLLEELSVDAMVRGVRVLRGQALREGSRPYEPWRGILRLLVLLTEPRELEAAVVAELVPETKALLGRDVAAAPELEPEATHVRLVRVVEALLRRCDEPLLLVLEDLQWAGTESLKLFARIQTLASELPLLLVASYRNDERPALPPEVSGADILMLERLSRSAIERLCASMLGERNGAAERDDLVALVHRRSAGNPFLALEVLRTLANEAGGLVRIGDLPLAEKLLSDEATERLVHRRVEHLSERDRDFLQTAAIAGRELDLDVLARLHPDLDVEACASRAVEAAVLSSVQGRWWFSHDKLRDALIEAMSDAERRRIHRAVAHAILASTPRHASTLAHHFGAAGDVAREKQFAALAGDQFLRSGAYHEAIPFLRRAVALACRAEPPLARAIVERQLGEALFRSGQLIEAREHLGRALETLGRPLPESPGQLGLALVQEATTQIWLRLRRGEARRTVPPRAEIESFEEAIHAYTQLSRLAHHLNDEALVLYVTLSALNLSERGGLSAHHARLAAVMGAVMGLGPVHRLARFYFGMAEAISSRLGDPTIHAFVLAHRGYYEAGLGHWQAAEDDLVESRELYDRIGDVRLAEESISILAYALFFKGELKRSEALYRTLERSGEERVDTQIISWGVTNRLKLLVRAGQLTRVDDLLKRVDSLLVDGITRAVRDGIEVELEVARGDIEAAYRAASVAADRLERSPPRTFMVVSTYAAIADAVLRQWKACAEAGRREDARRMRRRAARANRALAKIARVFSIAEPAKLVHEGTFEALSGRPERARTLFQEAARLASEREMPFEEALALSALARIDGVREASAIRERAHTLLDRLGASPAHAPSLTPP